MICPNFGKNCCFMKFLSVLLFTFTIIIGFSQNTENFIPEQANSVISINNIQLLEEISLDELIKYDFMEEVQEELFDGSTSGKNLHDIGIDFDRRMNFFRGEEKDYLISGITFGVKNKEDLFKTFKEFERVESPNNSVQIYASLFNRIAIQENVAIFYRLELKPWVVGIQADSIWKAQGNDLYSRWGNESVIEDPFDIEEQETPSYEDEIYEEEVVVASEKTYYELRDSVEAELMSKLSNEFNIGLFSQGKTLVKLDPRFIQEIKNQSEASFYFDNERISKNTYSSGMFRPNLSAFETKMKEFSDNNYLSGSLKFKENQIVLDLNQHFSEKLGKIYASLSNSKFDKKVLKYIPENNQGFFTYNINLKEAHNKTLELLNELFSDSEDREVQLSLVALDLWKELVNTDALFDTYRGSMFGSFHGIEKVKTKKLVYDYNEETFEYKTREEQAEEDMPVFSVGFSSKNRELVERILGRFAKMHPKISQEGAYWRLDDVLLNSIPLYIIPVDNALIITNDDNQAENFSAGYGKLALNKKRIKNASKGGVIYAEIDVQKTLENLPQGMFKEKQNKVLDVLRRNVGSFILTSDKTTQDKMSYSLSYNYEGEASFGTYALDLINSIYNVTK